jgi:hypothetical protein
MAIVHLPFNVSTHSSTYLCVVCRHTEIILFRNFSLVFTPSHQKISGTYCCCLVHSTSEGAVLYVSFIIFTSQRAAKTSCQLPLGKVCFVCISHRFVRCVQENAAYNLGRRGGYVWPACSLVPKECLKKCHLSVSELVSCLYLRWDWARKVWEDESNKPRTRKTFPSHWHAVKWKLLFFRHGSISRSRVCKPQGPVPSSYFMILISVSIRMDTT